MGARAETAPAEPGRPVRPSAARGWVATSTLQRARREVEELSRRGQRLGSGPIDIREVERRGDEVLVELTGRPPRLGGWEVVGRLRHRGGGAASVRFATRGVNSRAWVGAEPWCEHCGLLRRRTETYLVRNRAGEIRQIGSSCLRDYTGHDPSRALRQTELMEKATSLLRASSSRAAGRCEEHPPVDEYLGLVVAAVRDRQDCVFVARARASADRPATADLAWEAWASGVRPSDGDRAAGRELIAWGLSHLRQLRASDYIRRLQRLVERGGRLSRSEAAVLAGLYRVEAGWREREFLGEPGASVTVEVEVRAARPAGRNRFGQVTWHGMRDRRGRLASWFASGGRRLNEGESYRLRGRVRRHGEWRGRPVTVLEQCRVEPLRA